MFAVALVLLGLLGLFLVYKKVPDGIYVLWASALLVLNLWISDGEKIMRRIFGREDRGSG